MPKELIFNINYLGADQASFTLNFSRGASNVIAQYYQMIRLGKKGYRSIMFNLTRTADYLAAAVEQMGFLLMSKTQGEGLPLVAFRLNPEHGHKFDEFAIAHHLRERGWVVPAYTMAPNANKIKMMRVVVREDFSRSRCDALITDLQMAVKELSKLDVKQLEDRTQQHRARRAVRAEKKKTNNHFSDEKHSLKGKTGKSHGIC